MDYTPSSTPLKNHGPGFSKLRSIAFNSRRNISARPFGIAIDKGTLILPVAEKMRELKVVNPGAEYLSGFVINNVVAAMWHILESLEESETTPNGKYQRINPPHERLFLRGILDYGVRMVEGRVQLWQEGLVGEYQDAEEMINRTFKEFVGLVESYAVSGVGFKRAEMSSDLSFGEYMEMVRIGQ